MNNLAKTCRAMIFNMLIPHERLVNLAMDEVYARKSVELASGKTYGETNGEVTKTLFCIHINLIAVGYNDMINMQPAPHVTTEDAKQTFHTFLKY